VGIAVAAPQGLIVPVIRDAARLTVQQIATARADLVGRARDTKLTYGDLEGGTFTISNLGMFGVEQFTAVLNPPQVAILAVGTVKDEAVVRDGDLDGGTFTISNLGMFGIERFVAVLNPPQAAILAVGSIEDRVVAVDGSPAVRPRMELTLTCDHRAIDGATGAEFLRDVKAFLEEPGLAL
jgi:pyruvate dehydrogenase E2 component (dihydrolipoamide acetyltransferase)